MIYSAIHVDHSVYDVQSTQLKLCNEDTVCQIPGRCNKTRTHKVCEWLLASIELGYQDEFEAECIPYRE